MGDRDLLRAGGAAGDRDRGAGGVPDDRLGGAVGLRPVGDLAAERARTLKGRVYQLMRRELLDGRRGAMLARDVYLLMGGVNLGSVYRAVHALRQAGLVRFAEGSCRLMEIAPGAPPAIFDGRGRGYASLVNLKYFGAQVKRNTRASMATPRRIKGRSFVKDW